MAVARWVGSLVVMLWLVAAAPAAASVPPGFQETVALSGLTQPTAVRFAPDGRIFVAEKRGIVKVFDDFGDPTPTVYADLRTQVFDGWDRGLLGLALDPGFTTGRPYVYVLYAHDKDPNSPQVPRWNDVCPTPPGFNGDGCVISGRLSRLDGGVETVLIQDWCQQYPSHSVGSLAFGADGALYVSGGDGASFTFPDYGQDGNPLNPCGDPPVGVGGSQTTPLAQGGALRAQDVRTSGDPTGLSGAILRLNPDTGAAMAGNPNAASPDANTRRIVAYGLRNPFRITVRPGTNEVWVGEVGWGTWEEINRVPNPTGEVLNFGWPCYEGTGRQPPYDTLNLSLCETLYSLGPAAHTGPHFTYPHNARVVSGETCPTGSSSISSIAFTPPGGSFPPAYEGALFFADYGRNCIWAMRRGANGLPDPSQVETFAPGAASPVEITFGPNGDLYYVDIGGTIRRIRSTTTNRAPVARATATPSSGAVPLPVAFDGSASSDPDGSALTYAWDLDGDGAFDDSTAVRPSFTYTTEGTYTARLRVTDPGGLSDTFNVPITAGRPPVPVITITSPAVGTTWKVDDTIAFSGSARDFQGNAIPASGLSWDVELHHCDGVSGSCHTHTLQSFGGVASGSFAAPDHDYPSYLEIELTARDAHGLSATATRRLDPQTARLTMASVPPGATLNLGAQTATAPFTREVIRGSTNSVGAESSQTIAGEPYAFASWSNSGARNHSTVVNADTTLTATFAPSRAQRLGGSDALGTEVAVAEPGMAEVYRVVAERTGRVTEVRLLLAAFSTTSALELGLYADVGGVPTALLDSGRIERPLAGHWNAVPVDIPDVVAGQAYWIGLLNPANATGTLRWHDHVGASGMPEQQSMSRSLGALPGTWQTGLTWSGGPASAYLWGIVPPPPASPEPPAGEPVVEEQVSPPPASGPVGAWGFDEASGKRVRDASGTGNTGRISGAVRTRGRFGGGLSFDGRNDWVTVGDDPTLDLTRAMTLEAWVKPSRRGTVLLKERGPRLSYGLYARPSGHVFTDAEHALRGPALPLRRWSHLAMTWDGSVVRVYRDGAQVARGGLAGAAPVSDGPLRIGGNAIWPEFFKGVIDEVRIYDRALSAAEIAADRDAAVTPGAKRPPSKTSRGGKPRRTLRAVHRGTRWL